MYGEFCVTKIFTNADDIRLSINSLLLYTTDGSHNTEKKMEKITQTKVYCWSMQFIYFFFFFFCLLILNQSTKFPDIFNFVKFKPTLIFF